MSSATTRRDARTHTSLGTRTPRPAADPPRDPGVLVHGGCRRARCRAALTGTGARHAARGRARGHRHPPAVHDLRPLGCRRCLDGLPRGHRRADDRRSTTATPAGPASPSSATAPADRHLEATLAVVERCQCRAGCPSCVQCPSAATATSRSTRRGQSRCFAPSSPDQPGSIRIDTVPVTCTSPSSRPMIGMSVESV